MLILKEFCHLLNWCVWFSFDNCDYCKTSRFVSLRYQVSLGEHTQDQEMLTLEEMLEEHIHTGAHHEVDKPQELMQLQATSGSVRAMQVLHFRTTTLDYDWSRYSIGCFTCLRSSRLRPFLIQGETMLVLVDQQCKDRVRDVLCPSPGTKDEDCRWTDYNDCVDRQAFAVVASLEEKSVCHFYRVSTAMSYE